MGIETMGPPPELAIALRDKLKLECFVETGTYNGDTTIWAAQHFKTVITIEASQHHFSLVQEKFAAMNNIKSFFGDTRQQLASLISSLPPTLFFLDAHWCGGETAGVEAECPVLTELALIMPWFPKHAIIIDDARLLLQPPPPPHEIVEWPSLDEIVRTTGGAAFVVYYRDTLVAVPNMHRALIADTIRRGCA